MGRSDMVPGIQAELKGLFHALRMRDISCELTHVLSVYEEMQRKAKKPKSAKASGSGAASGSKAKSKKEAAKSTADTEAGPASDNMPVDD